jgi:PAS domain S-box-containing protein
VPRHFLTDLAALRVSTEEFLAAVLETAAQPIWVVDRKGVLRFANPAAITALGYDSADELLGRDSHATIHYKHPDGTPYPAAECPMLRPRTTGETVTSDLDWFCRRDGSMFPVSYVSVPIEMVDGRGAVVAFSDAGGRVREERLRREHVAILAAQRRVATLVAGGAASADVFAAIAREVGRVIGLSLVAVLRHERDGEMVTVMGAWGERPHPFRAGARWPLDAATVTAHVFRTGRPTRIDDLGDVPGTFAAAVRGAGGRSGAAAPIFVDGDLWGTIGTAGDEPLPDGIEARLGEFTELVATAISNTESQAGLARLAEEQTALRRVATLVARGKGPEEVFAAVTEEAGRVLGAEMTNMCRYEPDGAVTVIGSVEGRWHWPIGSRWPPGNDVGASVFQTGRPARMDIWDPRAGSAALDRSRAIGIRHAVAAPIIVEDRLWGVIGVGTSEAEPLPADTEARLVSFTELVAMAIANTQARTEVAASRARIVAATDDERRRVVRDLHDGAQQRLVHTIITLKLAQRALRKREEDLAALLTEALDHAEHAKDELRELAHGILPGVLIHGGLRAGVDALASRMPVPVENAVSVGRLPAAVEATAYFVIAEALTNVAKHAHARRASVAARIEDVTLRIQARDDGIGGARPDGSGLVGLADRLAVLDGRLQIESPHGGGTLVAADIPLRAGFPRAG